MQTIFNILIVMSIGLGVIMLDNDNYGGATFWFVMMVLLILFKVEEKVNNFRS